MSSDLSPARRQLGATALIASSVALFVSDLMTFAPDAAFLQTVLQWGAVVLLIPASLTLAALLRPHADRLALLLSSACVVGLMAAAQMMALYRLDAVASAGVPGVPHGAIEALMAGHPGLFPSIFLPGPLFPLAVVGLGVALWRAGEIPGWVGGLLAAGGILFPVGRIGGILAAALAGDVVWILAFGWVAMQLGRAADARVSVRSPIPA